MSHFLGERVSFIYTHITVHQPNDVLQKIALECVRRDVCNNNFISGCSDVDDDSAGEVVSGHGDIFSTLEHVPLRATYTMLCLYQTL